MTILLITSGILVNINIGLVIGIIYYVKFDSGKWIIRLNLLLVHQHQLHIGCISHCKHLYIVINITIR